MLKLLRLSPKGDTIVEVLIALAVLGVVMTAGYAISTRSLSSVRAAQERSEALKIAESQLELLRNKIYELGGVPNEDIKVDPPETAFCFDGVDIRKFDIDPINKIEDYAGHSEASHCIINQLYHIAIESDDITYTTPGGIDIEELKYTVNVFWEPISGSDQLQQVKLSYKAPQ